MDNKKTNKFSILLYIVVLLSIFAMFAGMFYMYYKNVIKKDDTNVIVKNLNMLVSFDNNSQINIHGIKPGQEESISFSVENYSEDTIGKYRIIAEVITPLSNMIDENFVYSLEGETENKDTSNRVVSIIDTPVPVVSKELGSASITPNNKHNYKLTVKLNKDVDSKKYSKDSLFSLRIKITVGDN